MDWKKAIDDLKGQAEHVMKQAEAQYETMKGKLDQDGDGVPDALQSSMAKAREMAAAAKAKVHDLTASLDKDGDGTPDALAVRDQPTHALDQGPRPRRPRWPGWRRRSSARSPTTSDG